MAHYKLIQYNDFFIILNSSVQEIGNIYRMVPDYVKLLMFMCVINNWLNT